MTDGERTRPTQGRFWAAVPLVLTGAMLLGFGTMVGIATDDPTFSVEEDYYRKALDWDLHRAELDQSARLGWRLTAELRRVGSGGEIVVGLADRRGGPVQGAAVEVEAFPVARGKDVLRRSLAERAAGEYQAQIPDPRSGIWELRFTAQRGGERFVQVARVEIGAMAR